MQGYRPALSESMAVCLCLGSDRFATAGAADSGRFGVSVSGSRSDAGLLGVESVPQAAWARDRRRVRQVVELARSLRMGKLGQVAIDSTRIAANAAARIRPRASRNCERRERRFAGAFGAGSGSARRQTPTKGREWKWPAGLLEELRQRLQQIPARIERLERAGTPKLSRTDEDSRVSARAQRICVSSPHERRS